MNVADRDRLAGPAIEARGLHAWYGALHVLKGIDVQLSERSVTALIGPSGSGKSTFLRWCNRLNDRVESARALGSLRVHGRDVLDPAIDVVDLRRRVGMVFQRPNPFPKSIYDNVAFGPRLTRVLTRAECDEVVEDALRRAALWDEVRDRLLEPALGLSGGQRQRLCIARTIATDPEVLLMDEPCGLLDPKSTAAIEDLIAELRDSYAIVIVTHNLQQAARASDHCAFFLHGELIESAPTVEIFSNPQQTETERYLTGRVH